MLKTGMIIAERYEIVGKIGSGGMADVYKAKDHKLNRYVAVKVLKAEFREDTTFIKKFRSEAQAAAGLTHPNIVNVFDVGDDEGVYYIVMELIEGITLKKYISKKGKLSVKEATSIAIQVSMGLETAHSHGIVHRDVKPQNIIISTDGKVKVTDFGIARAASSNTISSNVMGSVHYSSPEQVRGGYSDEKSDIYSLGITLYEMVTGRVPFDGDTTVAIAIKHLQEEIVPPSAFAPDLPYSLEQIIYKCTQKSVDRRYSCMEDVIADLKHSLIDPQGNFVKLPSVDTEAKTVVISDKELGEIKQTPKPSLKTDVEALEEEVYDTDYDDAEDEESYRRKPKTRKTERGRTRETERRREPARDRDRESSRERERKRQRSRSHARIFSIVALLAGTALLIGLIVFIGKKSGLIGDSKTPDTRVEQPNDTKNKGEELVVVPDLSGKTEDEARAEANGLQLGIQYMGEEASGQAKGTVSSQDIAPGTQVKANTTIKYYVSKGAQEVTLPDFDGYTGIDAQQTLEDMGIIVDVQKVYSEIDDNGYPIVNPGYVYYTTPDAGAAVRSGETVTLVISRGVDYGDGAEVPAVVGLLKNDALTTLGKFIDIRVVEQRSAEVPEGEVISQEPQAYDYADPDLPITIYVSCGDREPMSADTAADSAVSDETDTLAQGTPETAGADKNQVDAAIAAGEVWKCNQRLNTPAGYNGGKIRLQLIQWVGDTPTATMVVDGQQLQFPYQLDLTGVPGVAAGELYLSEETGVDYQELGRYDITFKKAE